MEQLPRVAVTNRIKSTSAPRTNVARALEILSLFDDNNTPVRSRELCNSLGINASTGFALIRALIDSGLLEKSSHGHVRLGNTARSWIFTPFHSRYLTLLKLRSIGADVTRATKPLPLIPRAALWNPELADAVDTNKYASEGPHRISFSNASLSNLWRSALLKSMRYAIKSHSTKVNSFTTLCAEDNPKKQIDDIDKLLDLGTDVLLVSAVNANNQRLINKLRDVINSGIPVVAVDRSPGHVSSMISLVSASDASIGRISAVWLAEHLGGQGRVWLLSGTEGTSPALQRQEAARQAFSEFPGIQVENVSHTNWQYEGGYSAIQRLLKKYHVPADGVWCDSGLQGIGSIDAFLEHSLPIPPHTGGDSNRMYKRAIEHQVPFIALDYPATMGAKAIETALDLKSGKSILRRVETHIQVVIPRGFETVSVKADEWAELHVRWQLPDEYVLSQGASLHWNEGDEINV